MTEKKISVIIPCYNVEKLIDRCIQSVVNNTIGMDVLEIICVDDYSTDLTVEHLMEWEKKYPDSIIVIQCERNGRQGTARNIGLSYASGEWISFVDSDDWIEPDYFECLWNVIQEQPDIDVVVGGLQVDFAETLTYFEHGMDEVDNATKYEVFSCDTDEKREFLIGSQMYGGVPGKLVRKNLLLENHILFLEGVPYEDLFWREILHLYIQKGALINKSIYHYYMNPSSTVRVNNASYHYDYILVLEALWDVWYERGFLEKYPKALMHEFLLAGYMQCLRTFIIRFENPSFEAFERLQNMVIERIPKEIGLSFLDVDMRRKYPFSEQQELLLNLLYMKLDATTYAQMVSKLRNMKL